jgi:ketosteroid isomerase-like protein
MIKLNLFLDLRLFTTLVLIFSLSSLSAQDKGIEQEILDHGKAIRKAFSNGDVEKIKSLHHPEVIKALGYNDLKNGRDEVIEGLRGTLKTFKLEFIENNVESILIQGNIAIEQTKFTIKGTPKEGGDSFTFKGRTMVTYIRYNKSPTGWATIREIIQPATD